MPNSLYILICLIIEYIVDVEQSKSEANILINFEGILSKQRIMFSMQYLLKSA